MWRIPCLVRGPNAPLLTEGMTVPLPGHIADSTISSQAPTGSPVPVDYQGLSIEWSMVEHWFGTSAATVIVPFVNLLTSLRRTDTSGVLRIGGNSQDGYVWNPSGSTTGNKLFSGTVTPGMVDAIFEVARRAGWRVIFGLNLAGDNPTLAAALAQYVRGVDTTGQLLGFELGNEPNGYLKTVDAYMERIGRYVAALDASPATVGVPITGPAISENADVAYAAALWNAYSARMAFATWHDYANSPNLASLLTTAKIDELGQRITAMDGAVGVGHSRMGEGNSTGSGGIDGVSNVAGAGCWLIDAMLSAAFRGEAGWNTHSWDGYYYPAEARTCWYTPFVVRNGQVSPRPPFYAMALFKFAPGRRFVGVQTSNATGQLVRTWALRDPSGRTYAFVINKGGAGKAGTVGVTGPRTGTAFLNLLASGGCSGKDPLIEGARLPGNGTYTWTGRAIAPVSGTTRFQFTLPECSIALVSLP
jgi:hypothetical protein